MRWYRHLIIVLYVLLMLGGLSDHGKIIFILIYTKKEIKIYKK